MQNQRRRRQWLPREEYLARKAEQGQKALERARGGFSPRNEAIVIQAFVERGIPEHEIKPRENCLVVPAWNALGRKVRKGEKGVRIVTMRPVKDEAGEDTDTMMSTTAFVFHISQTEASQKPAEGRDPAFPGDTHSHFDGRPAWQH